MTQFFRLEAYFRDIVSDFFGLSFAPFREDLFKVIPTKIQTTAIEWATDHEPPTSPRYIALIPAAGVGARIGGTIPKQYLLIAQQPILRHSVKAFLATSQIAHTYVVVSADDGYVDAALAGLTGVTILRCGGATRSDTVSNGLAALAPFLGQQDWVLVHDAARPGLTPALLGKLIQQVGRHAVGGLLALPVVDTVKRVVNGRVETISREGVWLAQTPQMFRYGLLSAALSAALTASLTASLNAASQVTDESSAVEAAGLVPLLVEGHACNLKVTVPADLALAQCYLTGQME